MMAIPSSSTARYDRIVKFNKYREAGVREYWIVDPDEKIVSAYILKNGHYVAVNYDDTIPVTVLPGCEIDLKTVFADPKEEK